MSTIKIDRGFTQKIQHKDLIHPPNLEPRPTKHNKKSKGGPKWIIFAVAGGAGLLGVIVLAVVLSKSGDKPKQTAVIKTAQLVQTTVVTPAMPKPDEPEEPVDPNEALYANYVVKPPSQAQPASNPSRPIMREISRGSPNGLLCEYYENIPGKLISSLRSDSAFPAHPSRTVQIGNFELSENAGENYGARVRGYLVPPMTGTYKFAVCGDDSVELWLSTDDTPANLRKLIGYNGWVPKYGWTNRSDLQSAPCELVGGQRYYLEAFVKENAGNDFLMAAWKGPVSDAYVIIEKNYLQPWSDTPSAGQAAGAVSERKGSKAMRDAAVAPARSAVDEQQRKYAPAYRYAEAADFLKGGKNAWKTPETLEVIETAILRLELLGKLRAFVQAELARTPARGVWTAFGGQLDVTGAADEGITVAPGRIVEWPKVPPDQMLRLVNATVPKAAGDTAMKSILFLASAVFCKEVTGGIDLALKYRERAVTLNSTLAPLADRVLGGTPETVLTQSRIQAARPELARLATSATTLVEKATKRQTELASFSGLVPGLSVEYWEDMKFGSLSDVHKQGALNKPPTSVKSLSHFATPENFSENFIARIRGYLIPSETGDYTFYIAADDQGEFWLSADETPEKLSLCVKTDSYVRSREWNKDKRKSKSIPLVKGRNYFVEALLREAAKEDHLAVAWSLTAEDTPRLITSENLLYAATAGFTPRAQELRKQLDDDLQRVLALAAEIIQLRDADAAQADATDSVTAETANELQKKIARAKDALREAESIVQRVDTALPQFKAAIRTENVRP